MRPIYGKLGQALSAIDRERIGLTQRLDEARTRTALLLGNEYDTYAERAPREEARLAEAEAQMMLAYRRLGELESQSTMLSAWRHEIERSEIGEAIGSPAASPGARGKLARRLARMTGWGLMLLIAYATLAGVEQRPSLPWLPPHLDRVLACLGAAVAFAVGYPRHRLLIFGLGLVIVGLLEFAQSWTPTRHGTLNDALVKATGLAIGLLIVMAAERLRISARSS